MRGKFEIGQVAELAGDASALAAINARRPAQRLPPFGVWQTVKLLGRAGMGPVYLAQR